MSALLPWQLESWQQLQQQRQRLPHALLFVGSEGVGKMHFASLLSASLLCSRPQTNGLACDSCRACHLIKAGNHPDLLQLVPEKPGQPIKIDAVRQLVKFNALSSHAQQAKVAIIYPAEAMNSAASNGLLKTLEEPADQRYIILVSQQPNLLSATLRSRCQMLHFSLPSREIALTWLTQQGVHSPTLLLDLAMGAPLKAKALQQDDSIAMRSQLFEQWSRFSQGAIGLVTLTEAWEKLNITALLWHLKSWISDMIRLQLLNDPANMINRDLAIPLKKWAEYCNSQQLFYYLDEIQQTEAVLSKKIALNKRLLLENLLISWHNTIEEGTHAS
ncbi:MAG: DNA polymerase III subunit delta' [Gammaproteobacteria bacterium]|nr:DNA polymerase III subunit delta' [Gammaproteobacteria bacterium]